MVDPRNVKQVTLCVEHYVDEWRARKRAYAKAHKKALSVAPDLKECALCGAVRGVGVDFIIPFSRGGKPVRENLRWLCGKHNHEAYWYYARTGRPLVLGIDQD